MARKWLVLLIFLMLKKLDSVGAAAFLVSLHLDPVLPTSMLFHLLYEAISRGAYFKDEKTQKTHSIQVAVLCRTYFRQAIESELPLGAVLVLRRCHQVGTSQCKPRSLRAQDVQRPEA